MPIASKNLKNIPKLVPILLVVVLAAACCFIGVKIFFPEVFLSTPPVPLPPPTSKKAGAENAKKEKSNVEMAAVSPKAQTSNPTPTLRMNTGTVGDFSGKQAKLEEMKLDVAIAEQEAKLKELLEGKPTPHVPQPVAILPTTLPALPALTAPSSGELPPLPSEPGLSRPRAGLIAVQGMDGRLAAVFTTNTGKKTVRVGDTLFGSKVRAISLDGVTLASGKIITLEDYAWKP